MAVNPWAVGTDAFLSGLAEREARSRQNLLDTQVLEQQRQNNAYRTQEMDLRAKQEERLTNRDLYEAGMAGTAQATAQMEAEAASQQAKELAAARLQALNAWQTAPSPEAKAAIAQRAVVELGVPAGVFNIGQAQTNTPSLQDQAASAFASGDTEAFQRALSGLGLGAAATRAPERPSAGREPSTMVTPAQAQGIVRAAWSQAQAELRDPMSLTPPSSAAIQARAQEIAKMSMDAMRAEGYTFPADGQAAQAGVLPAGGGGNDPLASSLALWRQINPGREPDAEDMKDIRMVAGLPPENAAPIQVPPNLIPATQPQVAALAAAEAARARRDQATLGVGMPTRTSRRDQATLGVGMPTRTSR